MIDPQISRDLLVTGRLVGTFPLDHPRGPTPQPVTRLGEGLPVGPGGREVGVVLAALEGLAQAREVLGRNVGNRGRLDL